MRWLAIVAWCVLLAVVYGTIHDQVTVRICLEYFTIGHPVIAPEASPTMLAVLWGVLATWWTGLILGMVLATTARVGKRPRLCFGQLIRPTLVLLIVIAACAVVAGVIGHWLASRQFISLIGPLAERVPQEKHIAYLTAGFSHSASYIVGFIGGIVLAIRAWIIRGRMAAMNANHRGP